MQYTKYEFTSLQHLVDALVEINKNSIVLSKFIFTENDKYILIVKRIIKG